MIPEVVGAALGIASRSFEKQSAREAAGTVGWLLLRVLKRSTEETQEMAVRTQAANFSRFTEEGSGIDARGGMRT